MSKHRPARSYGERVAPFRGAEQIDDIYNGTPGNDSYRGTHGDDTINGYAGDDTLDGRWGSDVVRGGQGDDRVGGGSGRNTLDGGAGNDIIVSRGIDTVDGGKGIDALHVNYVLDGFTFALNEDGTITANRGQFTNVERFKISVGADSNISLGESRDVVRVSDNSHVETKGGNDSIIAVADSGTVIDGGDGSDALHLYLPDAVSFTEEGWSFSSGVVIGNIEVLRLTAGSGHNDFHLSAGSALTIDGTSDNDRVYFDGSGIDNPLAVAVGVDGYRFGSTVVLGHAALSAVGSSLDDSFSVDQNALNNTAVTRLDGGAGTDLLTVTDINIIDFLVARDGSIGGTRPFYEGFEQFDVTVGGGSTVVTGGLDDTITVGDLRNLGSKLSGRGGDDIIVGGVGDDNLKGGAGVDLLTGGEGADRFVFLTRAQFGGGAHDRITDFSRAQGDIIDLSAIDPSRTDAGDQSFTFIGNSAFSTGGTDFELRAEDQGDGTTLVQGDINHDGHADFTLIVVPDAPLSALDFAL